MARNIVRRLVAVMMLLVAVRTASAQGSALSGKVTNNEGGAPVGAANVQVVSGMAVSGKATSADDGSYRVTGLVDGTYTVIVTRIGYSARRLDRVAVKGATTLNATMVELAATLNRVVTTATRGATRRRSSTSRPRCR